MIPDPTAEIKRIRHQLGAEDEFDVGRIFERLRRMRVNSGRIYVRRSPRKPSDNNAMHRNGEAERSEVENLSSRPGDGTRL